MTGSVSFLHLSISAPLFPFSSATMSLRLAVATTSRSSAVSRLPASRGIATLSREFKGIRQGGEVLPNYYDGKFQPSQAQKSSPVTDPVSFE